MLDKGPGPAVDCKFYHEDSYRQATRRACRLIERNPNSEAWNISLCGKCSVPGILKANPCKHLVLEAQVGRSFRLFKKVDVYAVCSAKFIELDHPQTCMEGCSFYTPESEVDELLRTL